MMRRLLAILVVLVAGLAVSPSAVAAAPTIPVEVEAGQGYNRLVFDWHLSIRGGRVPGHTAEVENGVLLVRFDQPFRVDTDALLQDASDFIALARQDADQKTLRLALKSDYAARSEIDEAYIAVNLTPEGSNAAVPSYRAPHPIIDESLIVVTGEIKPIPTREDLRKIASTAKPLPSNAQRLPLRVVRNDSRTRIVFMWPDKVGYDVSRHEDTIIVAFNSIAKPKLTRLRVDPPPLVKTAEAVQRFGGLEVRIDVEHDSDFHSFRQEDDVILDIVAKAPEVMAALDPSHDAHGQAVPSETSQHHETVAEDPTGHAATDHPPVEHAVATQDVSEAHGDAHEPGTEDENETHAALETAPGEAASDTPSVVAETHEPEGHGTGNDHAVTDAAETHADTSVHEPQDHASASEDVGGDHRVEAQPVVVAGSVRVGLFQTNEGVEVTFPWGRDVAAAVFRRGDYLWAIFDAKARMDLSEFSPGRFYEIANMEELPLKDATFVRLELAPRALVSVRPVHNGWRILLGETAFGETKPLDLEPSIDANGLAKMTVDLPSANFVHEVTDPEIGDQVYVVTALGPAQGLIAARKYVDFFTVASAHGLAIQPLAEDLSVVIDDGLVTVQKPGGLAVTGAVQAPQRVAAATQDNGDHSAETPALPDAFRPVNAEIPGVMQFAAWMGDPDGGYYGNLARLNDALAKAPSRARSDRRLDLARFYFAQGLLTEALGGLENIERDDPAFANLGEFVSLKGATLERMGRHEEALASLAHFSVAKDPGAAMWRGVILQHLGRSKEARDELAMGMKEMERYPRSWQAYFQMVETQAALGVNDLADATTMWDNIRMDALADEYRAEAFLTKGKILDRTGDSALALDYFRKVYPLTDGEMAHRARYHEIDMLTRVGEMSSDKAIDRLERLRYQWRGDDLELQVISTLGELYLHQGRYREALSVMKAGVRFNPQHPLARQMRDRMDEIFQDLYLRGEADKLPPMEAVSLYYDFKELTPIGTKGDRMIRLLSERLVAIGLLDQATELLEHQVKYRLTGTARAQVAMRLALIQLRNKRPEEAFRSISSTRFAGLPETLLVQRRLIEARALSDMGRHDHAIEILEDDLSHEAQVLRADIFWDADNWPETGRAYEALLDEDWEDGEALTAQQRVEVMRMAIAYALVEDQPALDRIRQKFGAQMAKSADARSFEIATGDMVSQGVAFRDVLRRVNAVDTFEAFMADFKTRFGEPETMVN